MSELEANVIGGIIIAACVIYSVWMLKSADQGRWPW